MGALLGDLTLYIIGYHIFDCAENIHVWLASCLKTQQEIATSVAGQLLSHKGQPLDQYINFFIYPQKPLQVLSMYAIQVPQHPTPSYTDSKHAISKGYCSSSSNNNNTVVQFWSVISFDL